MTFEALDLQRGGLALCILVVPLRQQPACGHRSQLREVV